MPPKPLDLSRVTDRLLQQLAAYAADASRRNDDRTAPLVLELTGQSPEAMVVKPHGGATVSVYLFHVAEGPAHRSWSPTGIGVAAPLALYYLVSAHAPGSHVLEQRAMSLVLQCFHDQPVVGPIEPDDPEGGYQLSIAPQSIDEIGRLWRAIGKPMRLSAVYRANVTFHEPPAPTPPDA